MMFESISQSISFLLHVAIVPGLKRKANIFLYNSHTSVSIFITRSVPQTPKAIQHSQLRPESTLKLEYYELITFY